MANEQRSPTFMPWEGGRPTALQCARCRQAFPGEPRCNAFPGGIPMPILAGMVDHREPFPGDGSIRWTPIPPRDPEGGPVTFAYVNRLDPDGTMTAIGVLWLQEERDAVGFIPAPAPTPDDEARAGAEVWRDRVNRCGPAVDRTAREIWDYWTERPGRMWSVSEPEEADSVEALQREAQQ